MRPDGPLPVLATQLVATQVTPQAPEFDAAGQLVTPPQATVELPLYEAVRQARATLLLGDLGSGKSTLAAELVLTTLARTDQTVAILVPVRELRLHLPLSPVGVLEAVDQFIREYVRPGADQPTLPELLGAGQEVLLVADGLDELAKALAAPLLRQLAQLAHWYTNLQVVATARPVELTGVSFEEWKRVRTLPLRDPQRLAILESELRANGTAPDEAATEAAGLLQRLRALPALYAVATTPLFMRLLFPKLVVAGQFPAQANLTLGSLLFEVVIERLERWGQRDGREAVESAFQQQFPSAEAKAALLGQLARHRLRTETLPLLDAHGWLVGHLTTAHPGTPDKFLVATQALDYLRGGGLTTDGQELEFTAQPLAELLAAVALATEWLHEPGEPALLAVEEWRVVSFAAGLARRWSLTTKVRQFLIDFQQLLLSTSPAYLPAVAAIVLEFQDVGCAQAALDSLTRASSDQLEYDYHGEQRRAEAQLIAQLLRLAGQRGVEWVYETYLNPRNPLSAMGLALVEEVLGHWIELLLQNAAGLDLTPLSTLVAPYQAYGQTQPLDMLPYLVLLFPIAFSPAERIEQLCKSVRAEQLFQKRATAALRTLSAAGERTPVLKSLLTHSNLYGQLNLEAASLWLELTDLAAPSVPPVILAAAFAAVGMPKRAGSLAADVAARLGPQAWQQHARWALTDSRAEVAAGAAVALYQVGQRDFRLLGSALLAGIDDLHRDETIESCLRELLAAEGERAYYWLAEQLSRPVASGRSWKKGLETGCWRLLLPVAHSLPDGPQLVADTLINLGIYTLPRYPEVREGFRQLLTSDRKEELAAILQDQLAHQDPAVRWGAAAVLLTTDPQHQVEALLVIVQTQEGFEDTSRGEWTQFCLSLSLGTEPLRALQQALPGLTPVARLFALAILYARQLPLTPGEQTELFRNLIQLDNWHLNSYGLDRTILADTAAKPVLLELMANPNVRQSERAASYLLDYHGTTLTPTEETACLVREVGMGYLTRKKLSIVDRLRTDASFMAAIKGACTAAEAAGNQPSFLRRLTSALNDPTQWETLVWEFMHEENSGHSPDDEDRMVLLAIGRRYPEYRRPIGEAARRLSTTSERWSAHEAAEPVQWLVLLADEFLEGLDPAALTSALELSARSYYGSYHSVAARALLARLPEIPAALHQQSSRWTRPTRAAEPFRLLAQTDLFEQLLDLARTASSLPSEILVAIYALLFYPPLADELLLQLNAVGTPGQLIVVALRFSYGQPARLADAITLLEDFLQSHHQDDNRAIKERLRRSWILARHEFLSQPANEEAVAAYVAHLDHAFTQGAIWLPHLALELLGVRGTLLPDQVNTLFRAFAKKQTHLHPLLFEYLCRWLSTVRVDDARTSLVPVLREGLTHLSQLTWPQSAQGRGPAINFLFAFAYWAFAEEQLPATQYVFLHGLRQLYANDEPGKLTDMAQVLEMADPLLTLVPAAYLADAFSSGSMSLDPIIRQVSRLMTKFTRADS
ncbi:NACHT domain-containing protein [Hymenobacter arizonensis]|uniref:NACHT domain-containing protein n=1 Tax=Hymenobacter arizonensis TaxID=1227077 RepID=A0A1I6BEZ8_HYMAR|nr:NACHT domain-containing protein [Hymenobacter arizonensis]SFQ79528.1 NACHT domain-containing protein [Hymenobacter arizonensis]